MPIQRESMKESVMKRIVVAAAMAAAVWGLRRWIDYQRARMTHAGAFHRILGKRGRRWRPPGGARNVAGSALTARTA
jgi:hypothetical protein